MADFDQSDLQRLMDRVLTLENQLLLQKLELERERTRAMLYKIALDRASSLSGEVAKTAMEIARIYARVAEAELEANMEADKNKPEHK